MIQIMNGSPFYIPHHFHVNLGFHLNLDSLDCYYLLFLMLLMIVKFFLEPLNYSIHFIIVELLFHSSSKIVLVSILASQNVIESLAMVLIFTSTSIFIFVGNFVVSFSFLTVVKFFSFISFITT